LLGFRGKVTREMEDVVWKIHMSCCPRTRSVWLFIHLFPSACRSR